MDKMLIRLEQSFIESAEKLNERFSEQDRVDLSQVIEANYEKIRLIMLEQEKSKDKSKPTTLELGKIGSRFFGFNIYYNDDIDDVPIRIRKIIPTISPVRLDLMATTKTAKSADPNGNPTCNVSSACGSFWHQSVSIRSSILIPENLCIIMILIK